MKSKTKRYKKHPIEVKGYNRKFHIHDSEKKIINYLGYKISEICEVSTDLGFNSSGKIKWYEIHAYACTNFSSRRWFNLLHYQFLEEVERMIEKDIAKKNGFSARAITMKKRRLNELAKKANCEIDWYEDDHYNYVGVFPCFEHKKKDPWYDEHHVWNLNEIGKHTLKHIEIPDFEWIEHMIDVYSKFNSNPDYEY
tara:strand:- start:965 stop:1552 length:588 start_codon:yes stop_codon:yes gene_type:complete